MRATVKSGIGARDFPSRHKRFENELARRCHNGGIVPRSKCRHLDKSEQTRHRAEAIYNRVRCDVIVDLECTACIEPDDHVVGIDSAGSLMERCIGSAAN